MDKKTKIDLPAPRDLWIKLAPGQAVKVDADIGKSWAEQKLALRQIRGNILASTVEIEFTLDNLLARLLFEAIENVEPHITKLNRLVFKELKIPLSKKIQLLKTLLQNSAVLNDFNADDILRNLNEISVVRNKFAHYTIYFDPGPDPNNTKLTPYLECLNGTERLDNPYFDRLNKIFGDAMTQLEKSYTKN